MDPKAPKVGVIGAGVVGLTVARMFQDELPNASVTILADKRRGETTSAVAAGIFRPGTSFKASTPERTKQWINYSWKYWEEILKSPEAPRAGVMALSSYIFSKETVYVTKNHLIEDLVPIYRRVTSDELRLTGKVWKYGSFYSTLLVSCDRYLPWAEDIFTSKGGVIKKQKVESFQSIKGEYDLVFNCAGFGAKYLCGDHDLVPIRGQVIKVRAPWLKSAFYGDYDAYVIPGFDGVATLGGTRQYDSYNTAVCRFDAQGIMARCCELLPQLRKAKVVSHRVGLRPHRSPVRVEAEWGQGTKIVHCYGHGGYGVTCAPGTAIDAVKQGMDLLRSNIKNKL